MSEAQQQHDVVVVGVGAMGSAACWQLARRGVRVLGLDQFTVPNAQGSSHGLSRMIRLAYYEHPHYVPLLRRAYELWEELERATGRKLLHIVGGLYMGPPASDIVERSGASAREHRLPHEVLDAKQIAARFPQFHLPPDYRGLYEPRAGFLLPERCIESFAKEAVRHGAQIHENEPVLDWRVEAQHVIVRTPRREYRAERVIFASGAWSGKIVRDLGVDLVVTRQVLGWVRPREPQALLYGKLPVWAIDRLDGMYYGFPILPMPEAGELGEAFKLALHRKGDTVDPDQVQRTPLPGDEQTFRPCLEQFLPCADGPLVSMRICLYTNSPDSHFVIDRHPQHERVIVACGFSGHGFKFAPVVGEALADLATTGGSDLPIDFLSLKRLLA